MTLEELLALLTDNTTGDISAADMRTIVTELWGYTANVQATQNEIVVVAVPELQSDLAALDARVTALEQAP